MNLNLKKINEKNIVLFLSFFLIVIIFSNFIHQNYDKFKSQKSGNYSRLSNSEFKNSINQDLTNSSAYEFILNRDCSITGDMHDRHKVRWVKIFLLKNIFELSEKINSNSPYYLNIFLHSILIFLSLAILSKTFKLEIGYIIFFLFYISFIFHHHLGEYSYSIFEMFFASLALYASKKKNVLLFFTICLMAILNRESGFVLILTWFLFNSGYKKALGGFLLLTIVFTIVNFKIINCMINPKFFIPLEYQTGQINLQDAFSLDFLSLIKLLVINYFLPFGIILYNLIKNKFKNKVFFLITVIYLLIFLFATPLSQVGTKLIILPLIILSFKTRNSKIYIH